MRLPVSGPNAASSTEVAYSMPPTPSVSGRSALATKSLSTD